MNVSSSRKPSNERSGDRPEGVSFKSTSSASVLTRPDARTLPASLTRVDPATLPPGVQSRWAFEPSSLDWAHRAEALRARIKRRAFPAYKLIRTCAPRMRWVAFFCYAPDGVLQGSQRVALQRYRDLGYAVHVVCAAPSADRVPQEVASYADSLHWKDLPGYDFSAYTVALRHLAAHSPGATVLVANDSVFGPIGDVRALVEEAPWALTGLTALSTPCQHVQAYAFVLKNLEPATMDAMRRVFTTRWALSWGDDVIVSQEVRMAQEAARSMSVGSWLHADGGEVIDPTLVLPFELVSLGLPYLKKSLLSKMAAFGQAERVMSYVVEQRLI
jgi:hypothetical protein